ncbi:MAG: RNB domain-containing ribonuclease [Sterolibacterium sp.]|nr:RNB domain-containing ribonuclease [Sterolibacterium sp.]
MNVLFEEDGAFKAGSVLADNNTSLQIELASGKRSKVKTANVLLRFEEPAPAALLESAEAEAENIDIDFLWEASPDIEFGFANLARDYYGHLPLPAEAAGVLLRLHSAPMYFHRKGKGHFRKAPPEILQAALAGLEKKRAQALAIERMSSELQAGQLPTEFSPLLAQLLYKPDRNRLETKALEAACAETGLSVPRLLEKCGAITSSHDYHLGRFLFEFFPQGCTFGDYPAPAAPAELPRAAVTAFSIDDAHTTEIDDAFSVTPQASGGWRIGIHIAAPGLAIHHDDALGTIARSRLSTVYMPGRKITMLPEQIVEAYTLAAGRDCPAISLYLEVASDLRVTGHETRLEYVPVAANLRHHDIEPLFNEATLAGELPAFPFRDELKLLWELACVLEAGRGKTGVNQSDYNFVVDWQATTAQGQGHISISERRRGSPLDKLVAELMIAANSIWGRALADAGIAALYRAQTAGKVRMTTVAAPHEGLGVDCYAWSSSPLRRYVDLLNQWQLIAWLKAEAPPFTAKSEALLAALRDFELTYAAYAEFQRGMERYWCLRWLQQENLQRPVAQVLREGLVRLEHLPLVLRLPSLPAIERGVRVRIEIEKVDLFEAEARARFVEILAEPADEPAELGPVNLSDGAFEEPGLAE